MITELLFNVLFDTKQPVRPVPNLPSVPSTPSEYRLHGNPNLDSDTASSCNTNKGKKNYCT